MSAGSRVAGLARALKLIESARDRWRAVNAPHLVVLVRAGSDLQKRETRRKAKARRLSKKPPERS